VIYLMFDRLASRVSGRAASPDNAPT
jgi:hypothetical protein